MIPDALLGDLLDQVVQHAELDDDLLTRLLRERFRGINLWLCSDDDMPARLPFAVENSAYRLYYVKSGGHCLSLTTDAASATGVAVARVGQEP